MALWGNVDANTSAPKFAVASGDGFSENGSDAYDSALIYGDGATTIKLFGVDTTEQRVAANPKGGHAGWVTVTTGSGGRAGRKHVETIVAMGSMTGDGSASANDDSIFADA